MLPSYSVPNVNILIIYLFNTQGAIIQGGITNPRCKLLFFLLIKPLQILSRIEQSM